MRKYLRQVAKARLKALGAGNVNKKLSRKNADGQPLWKAALYGQYAKSGAAALRSNGIKAKRVLRRVGA